MSPLDSDIAHLLAGSMVLVSFLLLYQDRMFALLNFFALHACVLACSVGWQAYHAARAASVHYCADRPAVQRDIIPVALHRIVVRLGIHRTIENVVSIGPTMLFGIALVALSIVVMLPVTQSAGAFVREDLAFALSVVLLGFLMMVTRRNAVSQVIGFMSLENGLVLAASGARGMPLVVEISVGILGPHRLLRRRYISCFASASDSTRSICRRSTCREANRRERVRSERSRSHGTPRHPLGWRATSRGDPELPYRRAPQCDPVRAHARERRRSCTRTGRNHRSICSSMTSIRSF